MKGRRRGILLTLVFVSLWFGWLNPLLEAQGQLLDVDENLSEGRLLGLGLQSVGSTCCISLRMWTQSVRGLELVFDANRLLFLSVRGLTRFSDNPILDGYSGAGLTFALGIPQPFQVSPIQSVQLFFGVEVTIPPLPQLAFNIEAVLEFQLTQGFFTFIGSGVHIYF